MEAESFYVGLARKGREICGRGYSRQHLVLTPRPAFDDFSNEVAVIFPPARWSYGFIDGLALATSCEGPVVAVSSLILPVHIGTAVSFESRPGCIVMSRKSLAAIRTKRPVTIISSAAL